VAHTENIGKKLIKIDVDLFTGSDPSPLERVQVNECRQNAWVD
jgi:hypothetical protein